VAEHTLALILAAARRIGPHDRRMRTGAWDRLPAQGVARIAGKTVGLVGFGRVARAVARRLAAFDARLLASDPRADATEAAAYGVALVPLATLLGESDIVSAHARLEPSSRHLIDAAALAAMKPGALLVNTARGAVVDEQALIDALRSGHLGHAALDVMEEEPLPADSPLRSLDNVTLTPHLASYSVEAVSQLYRQAARTGAMLLCGEWPATVVNPEVQPAALRRADTLRPR
jgi:D-3-phosphoglycerate dehydrogenase